MRVMFFFVICIVFVFVMLYKILLFLLFVMVCVFLFNLAFPRTVEPRYNSSGSLGKKKKKKASLQTDKTFIHMVCNEYCANGNLIIIPVHSLIQCDTESLHWSVRRHQNFRNSLAFELPGTPEVNKPLLFQLKKPVNKFIHFVQRMEYGGTPRGRISVTPVTLRS